MVRSETRKKEEEINCTSCSQLLERNIKIMLYDVSERMLKYGHLGAAIAHLSQGVFGELYINLFNREKNIRFPLTNSSYVNGKLTNTWEVDFDIRQLVPIFSFLSSVNHFYSYGNFDNYLTKVDDEGYNPVRWAEYAVSAGLMNVLVSMLSGISDVKVLFNQLILNAGMQFTGYTSEKLIGQSVMPHKRTVHPACNSVSVSGLRQQARQQNILGFILFAGILVPIWTSFITSIQESEENVPSTIYIIIILITLFYLSFGILNSLYMYWKKLQGNFRSVEFGYIILSFTSKAFLTYMTLFGSTRLE